MILQLTYLGYCEQYKKRPSGAFAPGIMDNVLLPYGKYHGHFVFISRLEVCQEEEVKKGGTWRTFRVPDQRHG